MNATKDLLKNIEELKLRLNKLILEKDSLQDLEIIKLSTALDLMLNDYNKLTDKLKAKSTIKR